LADYGGSTETHAFYGGSPAIDRYACGSQDVEDQRGVSRPRDGDNGVALCVRRKQAGVPMTAHLFITDACGPWSTFVGGGISAP
jgi:hypothetical protein